MGHPAGLRLTLTEVARRLADDLLRPAAEQVDRTRVPRSHLDALGAAGLLGLTGPDAPPKDVGREVVELVAGACAATWFVMTQHMTPLAMLTASDNTSLRDRLLRRMAAGTVLSGVAIAHLRRPDPPVVATRVAAGWRFDGHVGWMTSWGICDLFLLCGTTPDRSEVVFALVPAGEAPGLVAGEPMELLAMQATSTVALRLDGFRVAAADVVAVQGRQSWAGQDRDKTADVTPAVFGVQREVVRRLGVRAPALAARLGDDAERLRRTAYAAIGDTSRYDERLVLRAAALELC
ncbi:MAG: acyl-CoA dehydrogenase, partial [Frankiales bacterium]|nr:acyl-CoA dehydrogenase [Frankiales bacterium]